jgi:hypothetical protein
VINVLPTPALPVGLLKLCIWTRWCNGIGKFRQTSRILSSEEIEVVAESHIDFELKELEGYVTNVNLFTGVQFKEFGVHHVEILLNSELILRYPLPVISMYPGLFTNFSVYRCGCVESDKNLCSIQANPQSARRFLQGVIVAG